MIKRIKTEDGERWALVFRENDTLENVRGYASGLLEVMTDAVVSETFDGKESYWALDLLKCFIPSADEVCDYERYLKGAKRI
jgi:hypothetical protein